MASDRTNWSPPRSQPRFRCPRRSNPSQRRRPVVSWPPRGGPSMLGRSSAGATWPGTEPQLFTALAGFDAGFLLSEKTWEFLPAFAIRPKSEGLKVRKSNMKHGSIRSALSQQRPPHLFSSSFRSAARPEQGNQCFKPDRCACQ